MEADHGKLFVGGIGRDTTIEQLREYFGKYGEVSNASIVKEKITGRPRGFGFVSFSDASVLNRVLKLKHVVRNRTVEVKQAFLREDFKPLAKRVFINGDSGRSPVGGGYFRTKKIFVGGLPATLTEDDFREYFKRYGFITDLVIVYDQNTRRPRGFGFISFDNEDSVDRVLSRTFHVLNGKPVEVKRAQPKYSSSCGSHGVLNGGSAIYGPPGADVNEFPCQQASSKFPPMQSSIPTFYPTYRYGAPYYGFYGGYGAGNYVFGAPVGAYQPPYIPVGFGNMTMSYEAGPGMANHFPNVVGYGNQGYVHSSYIRNDISPLSGFIDNTTRFNVSGGGGLAKGVVNHADLIPDPIQDAGSPGN